ncbi:hypothetical protein [Streptomyces sp. NPDC059604]|uniref:hypothetical protein n=1 Tax=Streptomyces sp. NPDC059604 TaxID=3346881 RepID=UPI0036BEBB38
MARHLVDDVAVGWDELGTDLLDGAPPEITAALTGGGRWPSRTLDGLITLDGSPPVRMTVTEATAAEQDLEWGYVLRPHGIEVIPALHSASGPVIGWDTDPRHDFSNPATWPIAASVPRPAPASASPSASDTRRTPSPKDPLREPHLPRPARRVR